MKLIYKLTQYKSVLMLAVIFMMGLLLTPMVSVNAQSDGADDVFGTQVIETNTKLGTADLTKSITQIINVALSLLGIVSVVIVLYGGFKWMTAGGNDDQVGEARKIIFSGIIGLAIIMSAWGIASFVLEKLATATEVSGY